MDIHILRFSKKKAQLHFKIHYILHTHPPQSSYPLHSSYSCFENISNASTNSLLNPTLALLSSFTIHFTSLPNSNFL